MTDYPLSVPEKRLGQSESTLKCDALDFPDRQGNTLPHKPKFVSILREERFRHLSAPAFYSNMCPVIWKQRDSQLTD